MTIFTNMFCSCVGENLKVRGNFGRYLWSITYQTVIELFPCGCWIRIDIHIRIADKPLELKIQE